MVRPLPPFMGFVNKTIPTAFENSMSYYDTLCILYNYLHDEILPQINEDIEKIAELTALCNELKDYIDNYFDNLDVQTEINNKLDEMAQDGSLSQLMGVYIDSEITPVLETQNSRISQIANEVQAVASGSPAGVYSTYSALTTADPDHTKIYLVEEDGKWYFYDTSDSQWTEGGLYQATGVDPEIAENAQIVQKNLFENTTLYEYKESGTINDSGVWQSSANVDCYLINVKDLDFITITQPSTRNRDVKLFNGTTLVGKNSNVGNLSTSVSICTKEATMLEVVVWKAEEDKSLTINKVCPSNSAKCATIDDENSAHFTGFLRKSDGDVISAYAYNASYTSNIFPVHLGDTIFVQNKSTGTTNLRLIDENRNVLTNIDITYNSGNGFQWCKSVSITSYPTAKYAYFTSASTNKNFVRVVSANEDDKCDFVEHEGDTFIEQNFNVSVNYYNPSLTGDTEEDGYSKYDDYGFIRLPQNYQPFGKPSKLLILCGGTGERIGSSTNPVTSEFWGWEYFLAKGYAVMDMNGISNAWTTAQDFPSKNQHYASKFLLQSYKKGYEYVMEHFNLEPEVYLAGISMGGGAGMLIAQSNIIPVKCIAEFCPALSVYKQDYMQPWNGNNQKKTIAGQWNFADWSTTVTFDKAYFLANIDKIKSYDNLLINTIGTTQTTANNNYDNQDEADAYNALTKIMPCPVKIWHCTDDSTVAYRYSQFFVNMCLNGNCKAELRNMGTGGHSGGWNKGTVTDQDIYGDDINTSVPFYEASIFFDRW